MKYLILLNRKFPYKSGEAFLENEIDEISPKFDKMYIYPSDIKKGEKITREIKSNNVETRIIEDKDFSKRKIRYILNMCKYLFHKRKKCNLKQRFIESYFLSASYSQAKKIIKDLENLGISSNDKVYLYSYWLYINAKVGCILKEYFKSKKIDVVLVSRAHRFDIYEEKRKDKFLPQRMELLKDIDKVFACSDDGALYLKTKYPMYNKKITTGYLGTYDHGIKQYQPHKTFNIVSCSRLSEVKRVDLILESLKLLKSKNVQLSWTHIGGGELYEILNSKCKNELSWMKVEFIGAIPNSEVYDFYLSNDTDLFINVSSSEGLPVSIMEATSFGIPIVATNVGGTSEIVVDGISGYLLNENFEIEELANLILEIYNMPTDEYKKLRENVRKLWENKFQAKQNYKEFCNEIMKL